MPKNNKQQSGILLVIPCFNDSKRLAEFFPELCIACQNIADEIGIQVVDDGSTPEECSNTAKIVEEQRVQFEAVRPLIPLPNNVGKGGAIYAGWRSATSENWLAFVDADGAIPAVEVARLCGSVTTHQSLDGILSSRVLMLGHDIERTMTRHIAGRVYATLAKILVGVPVYDSQCGFKIFKRSSLEQVKADLKTLRFGFDMEIIANLHLSGGQLLEMPIRQWRDVPGAKVRLFRDSLDMFVSLLQLRKTIRRKKSWMLLNENN